MEFVQVNGTRYTMAKDGLFYKNVNINGISHKVPMYLNRIKKSWRILIRFNNQNIIQKHVCDNDMLGPTPAQKTAQSLMTAIDQIKKILQETPENPSVKYVEQLSNKKPGVVLGVTVKPIISKDNVLNHSPSIDIRVTKPGKKTRIPKSCSKFDVFSTTEPQFDQFMLHAVLMRKYYEYLENNNQTQPRFESVPLQLHKELLHDVDMSLYSYEVYIAQIEDTIITKGLPLDDVMIIQTSDQIIVDRVKKDVGQIPERKSFKISDFHNVRVALKVAHLYRIYLASTSPTIFDKFTR